MTRLAPISTAALEAMAAQRRAELRDIEFELDRRRMLQEARQGARERPAKLKLVEAS